MEWVKNRTSLRHRRGRTLLRLAVETALGSAGNDEVVVTGAHPTLMRDELADLPVTIAENREWIMGMSSSIRTGLNAFADHSLPLDGVVIMLCDQPLLTPGVLDRLLETHRRTGNKIVAASYGDTRGVPAFFSGEMFGQFASLSGKGGAGRLIKAYAGDVTIVSFAAGAIDIDTPHDLELLDVFAPNLVAARAPGD